MVPANSLSSSIVGLYLFLFLFWAQDTFAISKISAVGSKFFNEDGDQFFVKGIAYQRSPHDPLLDADQCERDASLMEELGANAIRVYHVDETVEHEACMKIFADKGIYLFVDLDDFYTQMDEAHPRWNETQLHAFEATLDEFQKYDNTAGVFVGNEVIRTSGGAEAAPYILAAARDLKAYRDKQGYRKIPIGYSAADIAELRPMLQNYLVCKPDVSETVEFFALNAYEWCGDSSYTQSGYVNLQNQAEGYPVPIFFSEVGCNTVRPRTFEDLTAIFGPEMVDTWSGAMVYEWIQEKNDYGLITYGEVPKDDDDDKDPEAEAKVDALNTAAMDGFSRQGTPTPLSPEFGNLKSRFETLIPTGVALSDYTMDLSSITAPPCPKSTEGGWELDPSGPVPSVGQILQPSGTDAGEGDASMTHFSSLTTFRFPVSTAETDLAQRSSSSPRSTTTTAANWRHDMIGTSAPSTTPSAASSAKFITWKTVALMAVWCFFLGQ